MRQIHQHHVRTWIHFTKIRSSPECSREHRYIDTKDRARQQNSNNFDQKRNEIPKHISIAQKDFHKRKEKATHLHAEASPNRQQTLCST